MGKQRTIAFSLERYNCRASAPYEPSIAQPRAAFGVSDIAATWPEVAALLNEQAIDNAHQQK